MNAVNFAIFGSRLNVNKNENIFVLFGFKKVNI